MLKKLSLPVQLIAVIIFVFLFGGLFNEFFVRSFYTFSILFKELLTLFLPFIIFAFVLTGILSFKKNAPIVLSLMLGLIFISNWFVAMIVYALGQFILPGVARGMEMKALIPGNKLEAFYTIEFPTILSSEKALLISIAIGIIFSIFQIPRIQKMFPRIQSFEKSFEAVLFRFKDTVELFLKRGFIPLLPLFVFGFLLKVHYENVFLSLFQHYGRTFLIIVCVQWVYLAWFYLLASGFSLKQALQAIKNALPSYLTAFSTMSSTATVPVSIDSAEKNTGSRPLAQMSMPIMANVHLLGDSIGTPILAMVTMLIFLGYMPSFLSYASFVFYFCTAMFAVSGIPGGGIIVMLPILESQLGFTSDMVSIITTLYFLMDSFGTAANVMGDGALIIMLNKMLKRLKII